MGRTLCKFHIGWNSPFPCFAMGVSPVTPFIEARDQMLEVITRCSRNDGPKEDLSFMTDETNNNLYSYTWPLKKKTDGNQLFTSSISSGSPNCHGIPGFSLTFVFQESLVWKGFCDKILCIHVRLFKSVV